MSAGANAKPPRIRLGMVGGGEGAFIGAVHRMAARLDDEYELLAAAPSSDKARAQASGEQMRLSADRIYKDFAHMAQAEAARADGIEAVSIVLPNHLHFPAAQAFLQAGIAVICDKPLTVSSAQARQLLELAQSKGIPQAIPFALTHNYSGYPLVRAARQMVAEGALGDIRLVHVEYLQDWLSEPLELTGQKQALWRADPALAGPAGSLGDIGTHAEHLAGFVTGQRPEAVSALLERFVPGRVLDDHVQMQLRYASGARGILWASQVACGEENGLRLRVYGTKASLRWHQEEPNVLWLSEFGQGMQRITRGKADYSSALAATRLPPGHPEGFIEAFAQLYKDFASEIRAWRAGQPPPDSLVPGLEEGLASLEFVEAVIQSASKNSAWVRVAT